MCVFFFLLSDLFPSKCVFFSFLLSDFFSLLGSSSCLWLLLPLFCSPVFLSMDFYLFSLCVCVCVCALPARFIHSSLTIICINPFHVFFFSSFLRAGRRRFLKPLISLLLLLMLLMLLLLLLLMLLLFLHMYESRQTAVVPATAAAAPAPAPAPAPAAAAVVILVFQCLSFV